MHGRRRRCAAAARPCTWRSARRWRCSRATRCWRWPSRCSRARRGATPRRALAALRELAHAAGSRELVGGQADDLAFARGRRATPRAIERVHAAQDRGALRGGDRGRRAARRRRRRALARACARFGARRRRRVPDRRRPARRGRRRGLLARARARRRRRARARAQALLARALASIDELGARAEPLRELARFAVRRRPMTARTTRTAARRRSQRPRTCAGCRASRCRRSREELRAEIVERVSRTGGHLASSLGAVELITALHYVFDTPQRPARARRRPPGLRAQDADRPARRLRAHRQGGRHRQVPAPRRVAATTTSAPATPAPRSRPRSAWRAPSSTAASRAARSR